MYRSFTALACLLGLLSGCGERRADYFPGYAEADYVRLASPLGGTLARLYLKRGDRVARGADAFVLEQDNERAARLAAQSRVERARAALADLEKGRRPDELAAVRAQLGQAEAALRLSRAELARTADLAQARFVAPSRLDEARAALARDQQRVNELQAQVRVAQLGARPDQVAAARQDVRMAEQELAQASWAQAQKSLKVPLDAQVEDVLYREGELVPAGMPVVKLLAPQYVKVRFFVPETRLGALKPGQPVSIACDGCGAPLAGAISFIAHNAEYTAPLIYSKENRASLVFMVEATPQAADAARLRPGQPVEVRLAGSGR